MGSIFNKYSSTNVQAPGWASHFISTLVVLEHFRLAITVYYLQHKNTKVCSKDSSNFS